MLEKFLDDAKMGNPVYLYEIRQALREEKNGVSCILSLPCGGIREYFIRIVQPKSEEEAYILQDYFYANIYNIISLMGGVGMNVNAQGDFARELACSLTEVFGVRLKKEERRGYAKCLNVVDRINATLGFPPFAFKTEGEAGSAEKQFGAGQAVAERFLTAVSRAECGCVLGIDIGGTSIKTVGAVDGEILYLKECTWNPAAMTSINEILEAIMAAAHAAKEKLCPLHGFDGMGVSFPDVVIRNKIVGGETHKTKGVRECCEQYESEFAKLTNLNSRLERELCKPGVSVRIINDGPMAAFTAAVELTCSGRREQVLSGIFAHSIGTELGTGWIDEHGEAPEYPLEGYNCIIDIGNYIARTFAAEDVRSLKNYNTGLPGTCQKFTGISGAFRMAERMYRQNDMLYKELFDKNYLAEQDGIISTVIQPIDMRREFMGHLIRQLESGVAEAVRVFEEMGSALAAMYIETEYVVEPAAKSRFLFGGCLNSRGCYEAICRGAQMIKPDIELVSALEELCCSPLMKKLYARGDAGQFSQAVGAVYFAMM